MGVIRQVRKSKTCLIARKIFRYGSEDRAARPRSGDGRRENGLGTGVSLNGHFWDWENRNWVLGMGAKNELFWFEMDGCMYLVQSNRTL